MSRLTTGFGLIEVLGCSLLEEAKKAVLCTRVSKKVRKIAYPLVLKPKPRFHLDSTFLQFEQRSLTKTIQRIAFCIYYTCV